MMEIQRVLFDVMVDCINQSDDMMCLFVCVGGQGGAGMHAGNWVYEIHT